MFDVVMVSSRFQAHFLRSFLVKINKVRYTFLTRYISEKSGKGDEKDPETE